MNPARSSASRWVVKNGVIRVAIERAMRAGIEATCKVSGVVKISAGNFEGSSGHISSTCTRSWGKGNPGTRFYF